ncbi:MAG: hypothetical protein ABSG81_08460 [Acidimicrobiales bacterium]|jgi:hypothetical protein
MSIVDDTQGVDTEVRDTAGRTRDKRASKGRDTGLWHGPDPTGTGRGRMTVISPKNKKAVEPPVFAPMSSAEQLWKSRIELVVSAGVSGDAAHQATARARRERSEETFDAFCAQCAVELRPVLDSSAALLRQWGLSTRVTETLRDRPSRLPRIFDLSLWIDRFAERGPGRLTITATEPCDFVRVKLKVGPTWTGDVHEHVGTTVARDLSDALVGGLVATLVERIFEP